jgi:purine-cytosine permease-like protein
MPKSLFQSKTFWFNLITAVVNLFGGALGYVFPAEYAVPVIAIGNVLLRLITAYPAYIVKP